ncbi:MAG: uracil-DNA glycosylase [Thermodesulfobacteriota bacterium]
MGQTKEEMISDLIGYLRYIRERGISYLPTSHKRKLLSLKEIREELGNCQRCKLHRLRRNIVFGEGNEEAKLMLIGEGPGYDEDVQGRPFVGKAGQLLTRILQSVQVDRKEVYITNIIKCRPPGNRNPEPDEIKSCYPFLLKQIQAIRPKVICALGTFAAQTLLQKEAKITSLRGKSFDFQGIKIFPTYHPAFLLRNPEKKKEVWEDIQKIMHALREEGR